MWFPPQRLPVINGFLMTFGALGALSATVPVEWFLGILDWRALFVGLAVFSLALSLVIFTVVPDHDDPPGHTTLRDQVGGLAQVFRDRFFRGIAPFAGLSMGVSMAIVGLWAGPWLRDVAGLDRAGVATHLLIITAGMGLGFFGMGLLTERLARLGLRPMTVAGIGMTAFLVTVIMLAAGGTDRGLWVLLAFMGFVSSAGSLCYSLLSQHFPRDLAGRSNTALNVLVFVTAFIVQWGAGVILSAWEDPVTHQYDPMGYSVAFGLVATLQGIALIWFVRQWIRHADQRPGA